VEELDLSELEKNFQVLNTNTSSQYQYINGNEQSWVDYQITLKPRIAGTLTIPSLTIGNEISLPLTLKVRPISQSLRDEINQLVFFEVETSKESVYVQEQLLFTRRLVYSNGVQLYNEIPGPPKIANALVLILGETRSGTTERNGKKYGVVEQRFAIFPEMSGKLEIPAIDITASVRLIERGRVSRKGVRVSTTDLLVNVMPVPEVYPEEAPWLPAQAIILTQTLEPGVNKANVGDTLQRKIQVRIDGNTGSILPSLNAQPSESLFSIYPTAPSIEDDTSGDSVIGFRTESSSIVPLQPGQLSLGETSITWWDTVSNEVRISVLADSRISAAGSAIYRDYEEQRKIRDVKPEVSKSEPEVIADNTEQSSFINFYWKEILAVILSLSTLYLFGQFVLKITNNSQRKSYQLLIKAIRRDSAKEIKLALKAINLENKTQRARADEILEILNNYIYSQNRLETLTESDRTMLTQLVDRMKETEKVKRQENKYQLPPLFNH
tara:strand:- start:1101 stop:2588 length:1488 start_codon:yes stop_codon:yes gene_type:complete